LRETQAPACPVPREDPEPDPRTQQEDRQHGVGGKQEGVCPVTIQISMNPQKGVASRSSRRKQIAGLVMRVSQQFNDIANINGDALNIEEGIRLVSLASLMENLAAELAATEQHNGAALEEIL
jgi:hypothetical protein